MSNPPCQWPGCECEARGPRSKWCEKHRVEKRRQEARAYYHAHAKRQKMLAGMRRKPWREKNRERYLAARRREWLRKKAREQAVPEKFLRAHLAKMQECPRLHLRALNLPCGQREICSGCERIGGRRVEFRETGFKFGRGA